MRTRTIFLRLAAALFAALLAGEGKAASPTPKTKPTPQLPEFIVKLIDIARNDPSFNTSSPLYVSKSRYDWTWLASRFDANRDGRISPEELKGHADLFKRLDRAGRGVLMAEDFNWADDAPFVRQTATTEQIVRLMDGSGDGAISREEWQAAFDRLAGRKGRITAEDLRLALYRPRNNPSDLPWKRAKGLLHGELGSIFEGPNVNEQAPDFKLRTQKDMKRVALADYRGRKPVVLIFGNYT